jgi:anionic cell wall polymer biosynthesis LytR-Cps2A-Psr (LCP) family protein
VLNGAQALELSRSRYFQYQIGGEWQSDPTGDLGRIERQNLIISAALNKAKSTYDPIRLNSLLTSVVHDFSKDNALTVGDMFSLAERYHAFSGSQLKDFTLPTLGADTPGGSAVEVVQPDEASQMISQFVGGATTPVTTPPLDSYGNPLTFPVATTTTVPAVATTAAPTTAPSTPAANTTPAATATNIPSYDPTPC